MVVPVGKCLILLTVPPLPEPSSFIISRSSCLRSKLNSMPISSWASLPSSCLEPPAPQPPALSLLLDGDAFGAAGVRARPLTFLRFMERGANGSAMSGEVWRRAIEDDSDNETRRRVKRGIRRRKALKTFMRSCSYFESRTGVLGGRWPT